MTHWMRARFALGLMPAFLLLSQPSHAGACCGGGLSSASLITGDEQARMNLGLSTRAVAADVGADGKLAQRDSNSPSETQQSASLDGSLVFADRFQAGARIDTSMQAVTTPGLASGAPAMGMGDLKMNVGYEFLPEWTYSAWKPRGYIWTGITAPTGVSIHETLDPAEALGEGFWTPAAGVVLVKRWEQWDATASLEGRLSLGRTFTLNYDDGFASTSAFGNQPGLSGLFSLGFSPGGGNLRFGARVEPQWRAARTVINDGIEGKTGERRITSLGADITWMFQGNHSLTVAYTDQTFLGISGLASNAALSRTLALSLSHRFDR